MKAVEGDFHLREKMVSFPLKRRKSCSRIKSKALDEDVTKSLVPADWECDKAEYFFLKRNKRPWVQMSN